MGGEITVQPHPQGGSQRNSNVGVASTQVGSALQEQDHGHNSLQRRHVAAFRDIHHVARSLEILEPEHNVSLLLRVDARYRLTLR